MEDRRPCSWCGDLYTARGIRLHELYCPSNPSSPKYRKEGQSSTQPSIEPKKGLLESIGLVTPSKAQSAPAEGLFQSVRDLPLEAQKNLVEKLAEELEFEGVKLKLSDVEELAGIHGMLPTKVIREILRRVMKTRRGILALLEKDDGQPLLGMDTSISMGADQGQLYEFLLNLNADDLQAKIDKFWTQEEAEKGKPEKSFMDKLVEEMEEDTSVDEEQVELPWEDTPEEKTEESDWDKLQREVDQAEHLKKEAAFEERMEGMQAEHLKKEATFEERMEGMQADLKAFQRRIWSLESETKALKEKMGALEMSTRVRKINEAIDAKVKDDRRRGYSIKSVEDYLEEFDWC